jgi:hypothetical protein
MTSNTLISIINTLSNKTGFFFFQVSINPSLAQIKLFENFAKNSFLSYARFLHVVFIILLFFSLLSPPNDYTLQSKSLPPTDNVASEVFLSKSGFISTNHYRIHASLHWCREMNRLIITFASWKTEIVGKIISNLNFPFLSSIRDILLCSFSSSI